MTTTELAIIIGIAVIAALVKSVIGLGYPLILIPALALFLDIADAIVIVAVSNFVLNIQIAWTNRSQVREARTIRPFIAWGVAGTVIGTLLLPILPDRGLRIVLVAIIIAFLVNRRFGGARGTGDPTATDRYVGPAGFVAGVFQGAAGVSGPIVSVWFLSRQLAVDAFVFAVTASFAVQGGIQIIVLLFQPQFHDELLLGSVIVPFVLLMVPLGGYLRTRLDTSRFEQLIIVVLVAAAISLLVRVV